jgi:hypothetical protein
VPMVTPVILIRVNVDMSVIFFLEKR